MSEEGQERYNRRKGKRGNNRHERETSEDEDTTAFAHAFGSAAHAVGDRVEDVVGFVEEKLGLKEVDSPTNEEPVAPSVPPPKPEPKEPAKPKGATAPSMDDLLKEVGKLRSVETRFKLLMKDLEYDNYLLQGHIESLEAQLAEKTQTAVIRPDDVSERKRSKKEEPTTMSRTKSDIETSIQTFASAQGLDLSDVDLGGMTKAALEKLESKLSAKASTGTPPPATPPPSGGGSSTPAPAGGTPPPSGGGSSGGSSLKPENLKGMNGIESLAYLEAHSLEVTVERLHTADVPKGDVIDAQVDGTKAKLRVSNGPKPATSAPAAPVAAEATPAPATPAATPEPAPASNPPQEEKPEKKAGKKIGEALKKVWEW